MSSATHKIECETNGDKPTHTPTAYLHCSIIIFVRPKQIDWSEMFIRVHFTFDTDVCRNDFPRYTHGTCTTDNWKNYKYHHTIASHLCSCCLLCFSIYCRLYRITLCGSNFFCLCSRFSANSKYKEKKIDQQIFFLCQKFAAYKNRNSYDYLLYHIKFKTSDLWKVTHTFTHKILRLNC